MDQIYPRRSYKSHLHNHILPFPNPRCHWHCYHACRLISMALTLARPFISPPVPPHVDAASGAGDSLKSTNLLSEKGTCIPCRVVATSPKVVALCRSQKWRQHHTNLEAHSIVRKSTKMEKKNWVLYSKSREGVCGLADDVWFDVLGVSPHRIAVSPAPQPRVAPLSSITASPLPSRLCSTKLVVSTLLGRLAPLTRCSKWHGARY